MPKRIFRSKALTAGWFGHQAPAFRAQIEQTAIRRKLSPHEELYPVDSAIGGIFGVVTGCVEMSLASKFGEMMTGHLVMPGGWFGEASFITGQTRRISAVARIETEVLLVSAASLQEILEVNPQWWRCLADLAVGQLDLAINGGLDLMLRNPEARCIAVLLRLAGFRSRWNTSLPGDEVPVTQEELAHNANLSRNSVGATLKRLEEQRYIRLGYRTIQILSPERLEARVFELAQ